MTARMMKKTGKIIKNLKHSMVSGGNMPNNILMLGIESSCDETAAAVVKNGREVLSNIISSQIDIHTLYGGVVPEIASRKHIERINYVIEEALAEANIDLSGIDAVCVTYGPGLAGPLPPERPGTGPRGGEPLRSGRAPEPGRPAGRRQARR